MRRLSLAAHYGGRVELDLCEACDGVWFDDTETARLAGSALLALIDAMAKAHALAHEPLREDPRCPRCDGRLRLVHNQSRFGRSSQLQCERRHGAWQSFAQFLREKGLLRAMSEVDRGRLIATRGRIDCVNCGAEIARADARCRWCGSVPSLLDVARLARALDPRDTLEAQPVHATPARPGALQCAACGAALPPEEAVSCAQCGATLAVTSLGEANAAVQALAPLLRDAERRPSPRVVAERLAALEGDLARRREFVADLQAHTPPERDDLLERPIAGRGWWVALAAIVAWLAWRFGGRAGA